MQSTPLASGDAIKARCSKCRKNIDHLILTMSGRNPVRLQCKTCGRQHKYRSSAVIKKSVAQRSIDLKEAERKEWATLRPNMNGAKAKSYSMTATYKVMTLINHPVFGLGLVQRVVGPQKIEVLFEDGKKIMRCQ